MGVRLPDGTRQRPSFERTRDARHVPTTLKKSRNKVFVALGDQAKRLIAEAYDARRLNIDAALLAARALHIEGGGMDLPLPEPCQWPPFATEAMGDETWVELTFADVFSGPFEAGPEPAATA
ncbi:MAG: hypothetical protein H6702_18810 [Myxococcales bacterium]|nr:hypothetical protein [Myxococcales bacterium]